MTLKVNSAWTQGLNATEKAQMEQNVKDSKIVLDRLREILYNMQEKRESSVLVDYDTPSWSHKQAHLNGEAAMLRKISELILVAERADQPSP